MAFPILRAGPYAGRPDGFAEDLGGVLHSGHVMTLPTACYARDVLADAASTAEQRWQAFACLRTVIREQITERVPVTSPNAVGLDPRGTWYWSAGDSAGSGVSFNWEDFIGTALVQVFHHDAVPDHSDWPAGLLDDLKRCLVAAVRCSHNRRVRVSYTNPLAMSIECSALAGELLGVPEFVEFARRRLDEWIAFTDRAGTFEEFNSPCYGGVTLPHAGNLVEHVRDRDIRRQALYMERKYFDHVCGFYHAPTGELALPHSRAYADRFAGSHLHRYLCRVLHQRRPGALDPPPENRRQGPPEYCHATERQIDRLLARFVRPRLTRTFCEWIGLDHVGPLEQVPPPAPGPHTRRRELLTWRTDRFCLGSVNEIDCWAQRRALGGYIRTPTGSAMVAWKPLISVAGAHEHDQQNLWPVTMFFNLCCGQERSTVLAGLTGVAMDGEWLCGSHWRQKVRGRVQGIRADFGFDFSGLDAPAEESLASGVKFLRVGDVWRVDVGGCAVRLLVLGGRVGATQVAPEVRRTETGWRVSLLRLGDWTLDWSNPPEVALAFVLDVSPRRAVRPLRPGPWRVNGTVLEAQAEVAKKRLTLRYDPPRIANLTAQACFFTVQPAG